MTCRQYSIKSILLMLSESADTKLALSVQKATLKKMIPYIPTVLYNL